MLDQVTVILKRDWMDYATLVFTALTGAAAAAGVILANRNTSKANQTAQTANETAQRATDAITSLRGDLGPTDRLLRARARKKIAQRLEELWNGYGDGGPPTPTATAGIIELSQQELVMLPDDALPMVRSYVDSAIDMGHRTVTREPDVQATKWSDYGSEVLRYIAELDREIAALEQDPQATGGLFHQW